MFSANYSIHTIQPSLHNHCSTENTLFAINGICLHFSVRTMRVHASLFHSRFRTCVRIHMKRSRIYAVESEQMMRQGNENAVYLHAFLSISIVYYFEPLGTRNNPTSKHVARCVDSDKEWQAKAHTYRHIA